MRISEKDLENLIQEINSKYSTPRIELDCAYGGYKIVFCKGHSDVLNTGFVPKKVVYTHLCVYLAGIREGETL